MLKTCVLGCFIDTHIYLSGLSSKYLKWKKVSSKYLKWKRKAWCSSYILNFWGNRSKTEIHMNWFTNISDLLVIDLSYTKCVTHSMLWIINQTDILSLSVIVLHLELMHQSCPPICEFYHPLQPANNQVDILFHTNFSISGNCLFISKARWPIYIVSHHTDMIMCVFHLEVLNASTHTHWVPWFLRDRKATRGGEWEPIKIFLKSEVRLKIPSVHPTQKS